MKQYDIIIVGGGVAGLYFIYQILNKIEKYNSIILLEKEHHLGGRIKTITKTQNNKRRYEFECGAGRIGKHHMRLINLLKELKLEKNLSPIINPKINTQEFEEIIDILEEAKPKELESTSVIGYLSKNKPNLVQKLERIFPYYSETHILNGLLGLEALKDDFHPDKKYYILSGGMELIVNKLHSKIKYLAKKKNVKFNIELNQEVVELNQKELNLKTSSGKTLIAKNKIVLALPSKAILKLISSNKRLKLVDGEPVYRIYAKYNPQNISKIEFLWSEMQVLPPPLRFIIPIDKSLGLIMISYIDSVETKYWLNKLEEGTDAFVMSINHHLKKNFPQELSGISEKDLPKPEWFKHCYHEVGAHYWKPKSLGDKSIEDIVSETVSLIDNILIVGEAYSIHQAWIEGALETVDIAIDKILNKKQKGTGKKSKLKNKKKYSLETVSKHNTKEDAWIVIDDKVYDITDWIDKHPGGIIIMRGVGKDASQLFKAFGHPERARKILKKYYIGELK